MEGKNVGHSIATFIFMLQNYAAISKTFKNTFYNQSHFKPVENAWYPIGTNQKKKGKHLKNLLLHQMISISRMPSANFTDKTKCSSQKFKEIICKYTLGKWVPIRLSTYLLFNGYPLGLVHTYITYLLFSTFCNRMENQGKEDYVMYHLLNSAKKCKEQDMFHCMNS